MKNLVASKHALTIEELTLMNDMELNPEMYRTHGLGEHNRLCRKNGHCILCIMDSVVVFDVEKRGESK